jgi:transposase
LWKARQRGATGSSPLARAKIRRMHFGQGMGIRTIRRQLNLSKKVVRKVVRSGATAFSDKRRVQPRPNPGAWLAERDRLLATDAARASRARLTVMQLCEALRGLGHDGGCDAVRRHAATWKQAQGSGTAAAFVPPTFAPGEACRFDGR